MTSNNFKSTTFYGQLKCVDSTDGKILSNVNFNRNLTVQNNLILGNEILDSSNNVISTNGSLQFMINKIFYTIPILTLSYLNNLTSNVQTQITTMNTMIQNLYGGTNSSTINFTVTLNGMTTSTFNFLKNITSDVQNQINSININSANLYNQIQNIFTQNNIFTGSNIFTNGLLIKNGSTNALLINSTSGQIDIVGNGVLNILNNDKYFQINNSGTSINLNSNYSNIGISTILNLSSDLNVSGNINNISATVFSYLSGTASNIQTQINLIRENADNLYYQIINLPATIKASVNTWTATNNFNVLNFTVSLNGMTTATFNYLQNITSDVQTQLNNLYYSISPIINIFIQTNIFSGSNTFTNGLLIKHGATNALAVNNTSGQIDIEGNGVLNIWNNTKYFQINNNGTSINLYSSYSNIGISTILNLSSDLNVSGNINNISALVFSYLSGATSNIQAQLNYLYSALTPVGTILSNITIATSIPGYLYCDGASYLKASYPALYLAISDQYGTHPDNTKFYVPNFQGLFLRGFGNQTVNGLICNGPYIGSIVNQRTQYFGSFVTSINRNFKNVSLGNSGFGTTDVLGDVSWNNTNLGDSNETSPTHTTVKY